MKIKVECYAGYRGAETPRIVWFKSRKVEIKQVLDRWLESRTGQVQTTRSTKKLRVCHSCDTALTGPGQPPAAAVVEEEDETSDDEVLFETVPSPRPAAAAPAPGPAPIAEADAGEERKRRLKASFGALGQRESFALQPAAEPEAAPDESDDLDGAAPAEPLLQDVSYRTKPFVQVARSNFVKVARSNFVKAARSNFVKKLSR